MNYSKFRIHIRQDGDMEDEPGKKKNYRGVVSSTSPDSKFTIMDSTSLRNFARQASRKDGVPIFSDHNYYSEYPIGRSTKGWVKDNKEFWADFFIKSDLIDSRTGTSTNDIISRIDDRIITDLSKGYTGGQWYCTECGEQFRGTWWKECSNNHVLGQLIADKRKQIRVMATVKNADLHHFSPVGVGSNPDAKIIKEIRSQLSTRSDAEEILHGICEVKNVAFPEMRSQILSAKRTYSISNRRSSIMSEERTDQDQGRTDNLSDMALQDLQEEVTSLRSENAELKDKLSLGDHETFSVEISEISTELRDVKKERDDMKHLADQGKVALDIARREAESAYIDYQGTRIKDESDPKLAEVRSEIDRCTSIVQLNETRNTYRRLSREQRMSGRKSTEREIPVGNRSANTPPNTYAYNISGVV